MAFRKGKRKKPQPEAQPDPQLPAEKEIRTATVTVETAELMSQPVGDCRHPMKKMFLVDEDTDKPMLVCTGCTATFPVIMVVEGDVVQDIWIDPSALELEDGSEEE